MRDLSGNDCRWIRSKNSQSMIWFGIAAIGVTSAAFVAEVIPTMRRWWRINHRADITGPKVKTRVRYKGDNDEL